MQPGNVALILTAHMPYVRHPGRSHAGEEALHTLIASALVPTLNTLYDLRDQGAKPRVALAYSPILIEQLADPVVQKHFCFWLDDQRAKLDTTLAAYEHTGANERIYFGRFRREWYALIDHSFNHRFGRNLVAALRQLADEGVVEPLSGAATHPCLARIRRKESLRAQIELGALTIAKRFGRRPHGFWPSELVYQQGANELLQASGASYVILDGDNSKLGAFQQGQPQWVVPHRLAALFSNRQLRSYLYDDGLDYRGDPLYLAPTPDADGFAWNRNGLVQAGAYDPYDAYRRAQEHAAHFADVLAANASAQTSEAPGIAVVPLDAGLVGARWFEGAAWLRALLLTLAERNDLTLTTPGAFLRTTRPRNTTNTAFDKQAEHTNQTGRLFQQALDQAAMRLMELAHRFPDAQAEHERLLQQAARELLLAQSSECGAAQETTRTARHLSRCVQLCGLADQNTLGDADLTTLETLEEEDNPFAEINYRMFVPTENKG